MSEPKVYEIRTVADFAQVPKRRLRACLREFATTVEMAHATEELLRAIQADQQKAGKFPNGVPPLAWPLYVFTWIDDGKKNVTLKLSVESLGSAHPGAPK